MRGVGRENMRKKYMEDSVFDNKRILAVNCPGHLLDALSRRINSISKGCRIDRTEKCDEVREIVNRNTLDLILFNGTDWREWDPIKSVLPRSIPFLALSLPPEDLRRSATAPQLRFLQSQPDDLVFLLGQMCGRDFGWPGKRPGEFLRHGWTADDEVAESHTIAQRQRARNGNEVRDPGDRREDGRDVG
jgi:hypothetical protein